MAHQHRIDRRLAFGACGAVILLSAASGSGADKPDNRAAVNACKTAHARAQESAQAGHLREARELFESCAKPACGTYLDQECTSQVTQLDADIPTVVPVVTDGQKGPQVDVEVKMDGTVLTSKCSGQALPVDPGVHEFTFSTDQQVLATQKLMIVQGQRNRPLSISTGSPSRGNEATSVATASKPADDSATSDGSSPDERGSSAGASDDPPVRRSAGWFPWVLGGVGLAGVGAGGLLVYWGRKDNASLVTDCPNGGCSQASVDHVKTMYLAGDIAAGAGLTAVVVSTVWLLAGSRSTAEKPPTAAHHYKFDVQPARSGGLATLSGAF